MRFHLRTLLIVVAISPPLLAAGWSKYAAWKAKQDRLRAFREFIETLPVYPYPSQTVSRQAQKASPDED